MIGERDTKTVLVIDDEPDICEALSLALSMEGYAVQSAQNRDTALRLLREAAPAIMLLDYRMPGHEAREFLAEIRALNIHCPIVLMTAIVDPGETARELGLSNFLPKPFELEVMLDMVRRCMVCEPQNQ